MKITATNHFFSFAKLHFITPNEVTS